MDKSQYRPNRSQQLFLAALIRKEFLIPDDWVLVIHHVIMDTPTKLSVQAELRADGKITFPRFTNI